MRPAGPSAELFAAFSRLIAAAFQDDRLISCPTLSKAPHYGDVLRRFLLGAPPKPLGLGGFCRVALRYALSNGLHLCFMLLGALFLRLLRWTPPRCLTPKALSLPGKPLFIIDTFAVLPRLAKERAFQELYMPGLADEAASCGREVAHLYRLYGSRSPVDLWRAFKVLAAKSNGLTELHLLSLRDWLGLVLHAASYPFSLARLIRSLRHFPESSPERFIREALVHTAGQCILAGEARKLAARRLGLLLAGPFSRGDGLAAPRQDVPAKEEPSPVTVASWYENQTLNKAFQRGLALAEDQCGRHVPVIGAQLFIWPDTLLNNHPDDVERAFRLTPDKVLVNGPRFLPGTTRQSYSVGPSLRYAYLFDGEAAGEEAGFAARAGNEEDAARGAKPLLVLLSYHPEEIRRVLRLVLPLAQKGRAIVYRFHPATRPEDFGDLLPPVPSLAAASLQESLRQAGAVIGSGSGSLAEAVAQGIFALSVEDPSGIPGLSLNYLPEYGQGVLWASVQRTEEVEKALAGALGPFARNGAQSRREQITSFRDLLFTEPSPERIREAFGLEAIS